MLKTCKILIARYSSSLWLTPGGKIIDAQSNHAKAAKEICETQGISTENVETYIEALIMSGWTRIGYFGGDLRIQTAEWKSVLFDRLRRLFQKYPEYGARRVEIETPTTKLFSIPFDEFLAMDESDLYRNKMASHPLTDDEIFAIIDKADLGGMSGDCGAAAIAINTVIFNRTGKYVVAYNGPIYSKTENFFGHVAVKAPNGLLWDAEGETDQETIESWGMLDPEDPDYAGMYGKGWSEELAYAVVFKEVTEDFIDGILDTSKDIQMMGLLNSAKQELGHNRGVAQLVEQ